MAATPQKKFSVQELQSMASAAALRFLDLTLDAHVIQVSERRFGGGGTSSSSLMMMTMMGDPLAAPTGSGELSAASATTEPAGAALVASEFLTALLEAATLFADTFVSTTTALNDGDNDDQGDDAGWDRFLAGLTLPRVWFPRPNPRTRESKKTHEMKASRASAGAHHKPRLSVGK